MKHQQRHTQRDCDQKPVGRRETPVHRGIHLEVCMDRPLGSRHPAHPNLVYPVNYGYVPGYFAGDGEEQDAYVLGVTEPVEHFSGQLIAIIRRLDDVEDKWVVVPEGVQLSKEEIAAQTMFQEQWFQTEIVTEF